MEMVYRFPLDLVYYQGMRRVAVTAFALFYAVIVWGTSAQRTSLELEQIPNSQAKPSIVSVEEVGGSGLRPSQKRILQNQFVIEAPLIASEIFLSSERRVVLRHEVRARSQFRPSVPPRAPPTFV